MHIFLALEYIFSHCSLHLVLCSRCLKEAWPGVSGCGGRGGVFCDHRTVHPGGSQVHPRMAPGVQNASKIFTSDHLCLCLVPSQNRRFCETDGFDNYNSCFGTSPWERFPSQISLSYTLNLRSIFRFGYGRLIEYGQPGLLQH